MTDWRITIEKEDGTLRKVIGVARTETQAINTTQLNPGETIALVERIARRANEIA